MRVLSLVGVGVYRAVFTSTTSFYRALPVVGRCLASGGPSALTALLFAVPLMNLVRSQLPKAVLNAQRKEYWCVRNAVLWAVNLLTDNLVVTRFISHYFFNDKLTSMLGYGFAEDSKIVLYGVLPRVSIFLGSTIEKYCSTYNKGTLQQESTREVQRLVWQTVAPITLYFFTNQASQLYSLSYLAGACVAGIGAFIGGAESRAVLGWQGFLFENGRDAICFAGTHVACHLLAGFVPGMNNTFVRITYNTLATTKINEHITKPCMQKIQECVAKLPYANKVKNFVSNCSPSWA